MAAKRGRVVQTPTTKKAYKVVLEHDNGTHSEHPVLTMKEGEAFTFIQRRAMSERSRMREVAERVLAGTLRP